MIDLAFWKDKRVFLTGHTGFKGSWLSIWLAHLGSEVTGFALPPPTDPSMYIKAQVGRMINGMEGDIRDLKSLEKAVVSSEPDIIFHLAAQPIVRFSYEDPLLTYQTNIMGTAHLLDVVRRCPSVRAVVIITTDKCYENREWYWGYREDEALGGYDPYSSSKAGAEIVTASYRRSFFNPVDFGKQHTVAIATARAGNVIGGGDWAKDRLIPDIIRAISAGEKVKIRSPHSIRPWQHVLEPLSGYLTLAERLYCDGPSYAEAWNFGPYDSDAKPVQWIVDHLCTKWPGSMGYEIDKSQQPHEASYLKLDCSKAISRLAWRPTWNLEQTLDKIIEWNLLCERGMDLRVATINQISQFIQDASIAR